MKTDALLDRLESVRSRGAGKWLARCPAHPDRFPSLCIAEGDKAVLLKCWAGCSLEAITRTLGFSIADLFYDSLPNSEQRQHIQQRRAENRAALQASHEAKGRRVEVLREAEYLVLKARGFSIDAWSDDQLATALDPVGACLAIARRGGIA